MLDGNPLTGLIEPPDRRDSWRWGTVVSGNPVRVRLDGDSEPSLATPDCLVSVTTGDRVRVQISNRRMTVFGKLYAGTQGNPGEIVINGTAYPSSGVVDSPGWTVARTDGAIYSGNMDVKQPFKPPAGWTFTWNVQQTQGYTFVSVADQVPVNGRQTLRVLQVASASTTLLVTLVWQLVKR